MFIEGFEQKRLPDIPELIELQQDLKEFLSQPKSDWCWFSWGYLGFGLMEKDTLITLATDDRLQEAASDSLVDLFSEFKDRLIEVNAKLAGWEAD